MSKESELICIVLKDQNIQDEPKPWKCVYFLF